MKSAGVRNQRITIETPNSAPNEVGDNIESWLTFKKAWAEIQTTGGREFINAQEINSEATHLVMTRWIAGVTTEMRIKRGDTYLEILSAFDPHNRKDQLNMVCYERL